VLANTDDTFLTVECGEFQPKTPSGILLNFMYKHVK